MSGSAGHRGGGDETPLVALGAVLLVAWLGFFAWIKAHAEISAAALTLLRGQLWVTGLWTHHYVHLRHLMAAADPATVKIGQLVASFRVVGGAFRYPAAALLAALGLTCLFRAPGEQYTTRLDLEGLIRVQARMFPSLRAFVNRRFGLVAPRLEGGPRPADPALRLGEWIAVHAMTKEGGYAPERARAALIAQLGARWRGVRHAKSAERAMFAVFALHAAREREAATELLGRLSGSLALPEEAQEGRPEKQRQGADTRHTAEPGEGTGAIPDDPAGPDAPLAFSEEALSAVDAVLGRSHITMPAGVVAGQHAFTTTALMGLLMHARRRAGVLAPGQFNFLKLVDRPLWYALHGLGFPFEDEDGSMPNPRVECLGPRAHWDAERAAGGPLAAPRVEAAEAVIAACVHKALATGQKMGELT